MTINNDNNSNMTTIHLDKPTRDRLKGIGMKGESYADLINKLLDHYHNFTIKGAKKR